MELFQVDDDGRLFISPAIEDWDSIATYQIDTVIDLEGGLDTCIPTLANSCLYIYFPIDDDDEQLPKILMELGMSGADAVARLRERRPGALFNDRFAAFLEAPPNGS